MTAQCDWPPRPASLDPSSDYVELFGGALRCWQPRRGYRFSVDAVLLAMAAFDSHGAEVLELGSGVGPVLLLLALNERFERLVGLEIQQSLHAYALENARLHGVDGRLRFLRGDLQAPPPEIEGRLFDLVVSNPPYYPLSDGHINPLDERAIARHEVACTLMDVLVCARRCLAVTGRTIVVYPALRAAPLLEAASEVGFDPQRCLFVRRCRGYEPRLVLVTLTPREARRSRTPPRTRHATIDLYDFDGRQLDPLAEFLHRVESLAHR